MTTTRRSFLKTAAATAAAATVAAYHRSAFAEDARWFKIGVCEWMLGKGNPTSFDAAKEIGLDGVQLDLGNAKNDMHLLKPDVQKAYLEAAKRTGLEVSSIAIAEMNNIPLKSDARAEPWLFESPQVAKNLGVKVILLAFFSNDDLRGDKAGTDHVVKLLKQAAPTAEKLGAIYGIESWLSAEQHMDIIDRVGSPAVQVYYDLGNSHLRGYDIYKEIRWLGKKNICEFHAKDYEFLFGHGKVDFKEARRAMDDIGYSGWIQIEGQMPLGLVRSYKQNLAYLKSVFPTKL
jgi:sugar phosphate isomerase/epimerase